MTRSVKWIAAVAGVSLFAACGGGTSADKAQSTARVPVTEPSGTTILRDDFSNSRSGWDVTNTNLFSSMYSGGRLPRGGEGKNQLRGSPTPHQSPPRRPPAQPLR